MARRGRVVGAPGRPSLMAALGVLGVLLSVWASAAPHTAWSDQARRGAVPWARVDSENFIFKNGCWLCLPAPTGPRATTSDIVGAVLGWTSLVAIAVVTALTLAAGVRAVLGLLRERERGIPEVGDPADIDLDAVAVALIDDAPVRLQALWSGTPAQGIIAAWTRLEASLGHVGVPLVPSRTSSEVCLTVLDLFAVPPGTLHGLAALYREARWSRHTLTEDDRTRAAAAYRTLESTLQRVPSPRRQGAP